MCPKEEGTRARTHARRNCGLEVTDGRPSLSGATVNQIGGDGANEDVGNGRGTEGVFWENQRGSSRPSSPSLRQSFPSTLPAVVAAVAYVDVGKNMVKWADIGQRVCTQQHMR